MCLMAVSKKDSMLELNIFQGLSVFFRRLDNVWHNHDKFCP